MGRPQRKAVNVRLSVNMIGKPALKGIHLTYNEVVGTHTCHEIVELDAQATASAGPVLERLPTGTATAHACSTHP